MNQKLQITACLLFAICLFLPATTPVLATDEEAPSPANGPTNATASAPATSLTLLNDEQAEALSPLNREMREILLREQTDVMNLTREMKQSTDRLARLDMQRRISDRKLLTQVDLLEAQGRHARLAGQTALAEEAENAATRLMERAESRRIDRGSER